MIGKGSYSKVYLVQKKSSGKEYAAKISNKEFSKSQYNQIGSMQQLPVQQGIYIPVQSLDFFGNFNWTMIKISTGIFLWSMKCLKSTFAVGAMAW